MVPLLQLDLAASSLSGSIPLLYPMQGQSKSEWLLKSSDKKPYQPGPLKSSNKEGQEWLQQAQQNVNQWKKQQVNQAWLNQFAETA